MTDKTAEEKAIRYAILSVDPTGLKPSKVNARRHLRRIAYLAGHAEGKAEGRKEALEYAIELAASCMDANAGFDYQYFVAAIEKELAK